MSNLLVYDVYNDLEEFYSRREAFNRMGICERFCIGEEKDMASAKPSGANNEQWLSHNDLVFQHHYTYLFSWRLQGNPFHVRRTIVAVVL
jgi:hypothetical protein